MPAATHWAIIGILFLVSFSACAPAVPDLQKLAPLPEAPFCRIAVLPFVNQSGFDQGEVLFYRIFISELAKRGNFVIAQEGDVRDVFRQLRLRPGAELPDIDQMRIAADRLGVQLLVVGRIIEMEERNIRDRFNPVLSVNIQLVEAATGKTLWTTYHKRSGEHYRKVMHFGLVNTATRLARRVSYEILDLWFVEGMKECPDY